MERISTGLTCAILTFTVGVGVANLVTPAKSHAVMSVGTPVPCPQHTLVPPAVVEAEPDAHTDEAQKVTPPHSVSISPYEIKRLIDQNRLPDCQDSLGEFDFEAIWEKLDLQVANRLEAIPGRCVPRVKAVIDAIEVDRKPGKEILLELDFGEPFATLYLIFGHSTRGGSSGWFLFGSIPYEYGAPFIPPTHRVRSDGRHSWLVIDHQTGHGSGFGTAADDWYEVSENGVSQVLTYQNYFFLGQGSPTVDRRTKVLTCENHDRISTITLHSTTSYGYYDGRPPVESFKLGTSTRTATFVKGPGMDKFVLDEGHSEVSAEEIDNSGSEADTDSRVLKYNYAEFVKILAKGTARQKDWLRNFLEKCEQCGDSAERRSLQNALEGAQP